MMAIDQLVREVEALPEEDFSVIMSFIGYIKMKRLQCIPENMLMSEKSLAENWDTPEEDEAWAYL